MFTQCCSSTLSVFNIHNIQQAIGDTKDHLLFLHAISRCDTVSAMYKQSKRKAFHMIHKKEDYDLLDTFLQSKSTNEEAGEAFILKLYDASSFKSLDDYRSIAYKKIIGGSSLTSTFQLESLPPTSVVEKQHSCLPCLPYCSRMDG